MSARIHTTAGKYYIHVTCTASDNHGEWRDECRRLHANVLAAVKALGTTDANGYNPGVTSPLVNKNEQVECAVQNVAREHVMDLLDALHKVTIGF